MDGPDSPQCCFYDFTSIFKYDDGGGGYDWTASSYDYPQDLCTKFVETLSSEQLLKDSKLDLALVHFNSLNIKQKFAYTCIMNLLFANVDNTGKIQLYGWSLLVQMELENHI